MSYEKTNQSTINNEQMMPKQTNKTTNITNRNSSKDVDMNLYKSLVNKLEMEQNNRKNLNDYKESEENFKITESPQFQDESKISLASSTNSQPLSRNLLSRDGFNKMVCSQFSFPYNLNLGKFPGSN